MSDPTMWRPAVGETVGWRAGMFAADVLCLLVTRVHRDQVDCIDLVDDCRPIHDVDIGSLFPVTALTLDQRISLPDGSSPSWRDLAAAASSKWGVTPAEFTEGPSHGD